MKYYKKVSRYLLQGVIILYTSLSFAQKNKPIRVEIEGDFDAENSIVAPVGEDGIFFVYQSEESAKDGQKTWVFDLYDKQLKKKWSKNYPVAKNLMLFKHFIDGKKIYLFFGKGDQESTVMEKGNALVIKIDVKDEEIKQSLSILNANFDISDFYVMGKNAFLIGTNYPTSLDKTIQTLFACTCIPCFTGLSYIHYNPLIGNIDLSKNTLRIIPAVFPRNAYPESSEINSKEKKLSVVIGNYPKKKEYVLYVNEYDIESKLLQSTRINPGDQERMLTAGKISYLKDKKIIIGTYENKLIKQPFKITFGNKRSLAGNTVGFYFTEFSGNQQKYIKYYEWVKFQSLVKAMGIEEQGNVADKKKKETKAVKDKSVETPLGFSILTHEIVEKNDELIMIAELYYPTYRTEYTTSYNPTTKRTETRAVSVFDGYQFTNAIVAGFDHQGNLKWNNQIEISDIKTFNLKERVHVSFEKERIALVYNYNGGIHSKIIKGSEIIEEKEMTKIETGGQNDKVKLNRGSDMEYWYDNYFIAWGFQTIKDESKSLFEKRKRYVFYMNKIAFK